MTTEETKTGTTTAPVLVVKEDALQALVRIVQGITPGSLKNILARSKAVAGATATYLAWDMEGLTARWHAAAVLGPLMLYMLCATAVDMVKARRGDPTES